jgi:hypothetical protein
MACDAQSLRSGRIFPSTPPARRSPRYARAVTTRKHVGFVVHLLCHVVSSCDEGFDIHPASRCTKVLQGLRIDPRRLMSKLLHVLNVRPRINSGMAVRTALAPQFQHT